MESFSISARRNPFIHSFVARTIRNTNIKISMERLYSISLREKFGANSSLNFSLLFPLSVLLLVLLEIG